ncbi:BLUF domain-containing protein [Spongiibacter nanhainus]|uniref:BLUF domain-containing protein n=1 Tax=Spongiibacter nanhainus TaxID=2794344 RepID=A0A7T4R009_9GAMM|nr:BLUF domain-containing protein [Spongiibacter nanhainus]QQD17934.1 BLUF domain-containing protein [Spongiibacter nanhainus]
MTKNNFEEDLVRCIYASTAAKELQLADLKELLVEARKKNAELGVTGILLYENGALFQVLEGTSSTIEQLYNTIKSDKRHQRIIKLIYEPIEAREFANWSMGLATVSLDELNEIEGLNDFFCRGKCFTDLDEGRVKKLLAAFKEGRWRNTISG